MRVEEDALNLKDLSYLRGQWRALLANLCSSSIFLEMKGVLNLWESARLSGNLWVSDPKLTLPLDQFLFAKEYLKVVLRFSEL